MSIEIFNISKCFKAPKGWQLDVNFFDLGEGQKVKKKAYPLARTPLLPIGAEILDNFKVDKLSGYSKLFLFDDLSKGEIISIADLPENLYRFDTSAEINTETKLYSVKQNNSTYVFFCYELFRTFLCLDNRLIPYLLSYNVMESFIDNEEVALVDGKKRMTLELNDHFPRSFLRSKKLMEKYLLILYNSDIRNYWKSLQGKTNGGQNYFEFDDLNFRNISLTFRARDYNGYTLIYYVEEFNSKIDFPFDELVLYHASFRSLTGSKNKRDKPKKRSFTSPIATNHDADNNDTTKHNSDESLSVLPLNYEFDRKVSITKQKLETGDTDFDKSSKRAYPEFKLKDSKLGLNEEGKDGERTFLNLNRDSLVNTFDYAEIPKGLVLFSKAISIVTNTLGIRFSYELKSFPVEASFSTIDNDKRKVLIITIQHQPSVYILEVDSSDDRYISTLFITNILTDHVNLFFEELLVLASNKSGQWPEKFLSDYCTHAKLKHPRKRKGDENLSEEERNENYVERIAYKLARLFT